MKFLVCLAFCMLIGQGDAGTWGRWFSNTFTDTVNTDENIDPHVDFPVTQECINQAQFGQCAFYQCLEDRFPCGTDGYTQKISFHFCNKIDTSYENFDDFGKLWLNRTGICLTSGEQLAIYQSEQTSCAAIKEAGIRAINNCNKAKVNGEDFCHFLETNGEHYNGLMGTYELGLIASLRDPSVWSGMVSGAVGCGVQGIRESLSGMGLSVSNMVSNLAARFSGLFN